MQLQDRKNWCYLSWEDSFKDNSPIVSEQICSVGSVPMQSVSKMKRNGTATLKTHCRILRRKRHVEDQRIQSGRR